MNRHFSRSPRHATIEMTLSLMACQRTAEQDPSRPRTHDLDQNRLIHLNDHNPNLTFFFFPKSLQVVLAYSGGLDTSIILKWLQDTYGCEVVTFTADLGQGEELEPARAKAEQMGVKVRFFVSLSRKILLALNCARRVPLWRFLVRSCEGFLTIPIRSIQYVPIHPPDCLPIQKTDFWFPK